MNDKEKEIKNNNEADSKPDYFTVMPAVVRYDNRLKANEKILYSEILTLSKKHGYCYASNKHLSDLYGVSVRGISKWINNLVMYGYLTVENEYKRGTSYILRRKLYPTNVHDIWNNSSIYIEQTFHNDMEQKLQGDMEQKFQDNNTSINNKSNNKSNNSRADTKEDDFINEVVDYLNEKTGTDFKVSTKQTRSLIKARMNEGYSIDDFKKVIDTKTNQWLSKSEMRMYLRPQTLFGNKFESYLQEYSAKDSVQKSRDEFTRGWGW